MNGVNQPLPGLLDDPQVQSTDLPTLNDFHIAPLRNPAPSRTRNALSPLEPVASKVVPSRAESSDKPARGRHVENRKGTPKITPGEVILARNAKKPKLAINELLHNNAAADFEPTYLPSFVSLAVVERSPIQPSTTLDQERASKRPRLENDAEHGTSDDYIRLPRPPQRDDRSAPRPLPLLPAMVTGLYEPPHSAALLPSMDLEAHSKDKGHDPVTVSLVKKPLAKDRRSYGRPPEMMLNTPEVQPATIPVQSEADRNDTTDEVSGESLQSPPVAAVEARSSRRAPRKWTELETLHLMAGVEKYGIGRWKQILHDDEYHFDDRSTVDLKDRFRVCMPDKYNNRPRSQRRGAQQPLRQASFSTVNIAQSSPTMMGKDDLEVSPINNLRSRHSRRTRHSTTKDVGVNDMYAGSPTEVESKSARRKRRPWTAEEDEALMMGVAKHGFQWTAIQSDPYMKLLHRRSTDLRDRIRNKFPEGYKHAETAPLRDKAESSSTLVEGGGTESAGGLLSSAEKIRASGPKIKPSTKYVKARRKSTGIGTREKTSSGGGGDLSQSQEQPGLPTLPPLTLDDGDWDFEDNTLAPLLGMDWDEMGI